MSASIRPVESQNIERLIHEFMRNPLACNQAKALLPTSDGAEMVLRFAHRAMHDARLKVSASELLQAAAHVAADLEAKKHF